MKWTLGKRTAFGSLLLALAVAGGFAALIVAVAALKRAGDATQHAEAAIVTADALERALIDLETGQRGFVITHDEASLHTAQNARRQIRPLGHRLRTLASGDPAQQARAAAIVQSIDAYQRTYSTPLIGVARVDPARARRLVTADRGRQLSDAIRTQFAEFSRAEDRLVAESRRSASAAARRAYWIAGLAGGAVLFLVLAFAGLLRRLVVRPVRELARSARKLGRGDLSARVDVPGDGEVGELGTAFNEMAESLQAAHEEVRAERSWIESLYRFAERISAQTDVEELGRVALEQLGELTGAELGALYAGDGDDLWIAAEWGMPDEVLRPFAQADRVTLGRLHELRLPLRHGDRLVGVAVLARADGNPLDPAAVEAAESLAGPVAVALANDLAYQATRRLADINQIVLDSTRDGIVMLDPDGRRVLINEAYQRQMSEIGVPANLPFGERTQAFADRTTDPEGFVARLEGLTGDRVAETVTELTIAESGRSYQLFSSPAFEAGQFVGRVYVLHEVTGERQADRLKAELLATVSHELRTPLAGILGFAELLLRPGLDDATRTTYVETVHREALRLTGLINDFLDLQRIEEGAFNLVLEPIHLQDVVRQQIELHARESARHTLSLEEADAPAEVLADRARLAQVVGNLLSNAIKYSPGGGAVRVQVHAGPRAVRVVVTDEGIGIPREQQERIFEKFFRADSSDTREIGGTGLGLTLSRELVEAQGGTIGFESTPGQGSTFWFELPALGADAANGLPRVLVVGRDSSPLAEYLEQDGFHVETVVAGPEALRRIVADPPALVCLDIDLPGPLDGWDVLAELKTRSDTASLPVVVCTASNGRRRASALGAADVLAKPFSREDLLTAVRRLVPAPTGRVLVVDDDETVRTLVCETLRGAGFDPVEAADGVEALEEVARTPPDAIVLDLMMPNLDGFEVLDRLRADPEGREIPVVVLTARDLSAGERSLVRSRAVSLLEKSAYSPDELRRLVRQALGAG